MTVVKWILILKLLGQDHETGEIDWRQNEGIQHDVYCMKMPEEQTVEEKDDK